MKYSAIHVAAYLINYAIDKKTPISNLELQNLLFYVQDEYSRLNGGSGGIFTEEIIATDCGPLVSEVYSIYKINFNEKITKKQTIHEECYTTDGKEWKYRDINSIISNRDKMFINKVFRQHIGENLITASLKIKDKIIKNKKQTTAVFRNNRRQLLTKDKGRKYSRKTRKARRKYRF